MNQNKYKLKYDKNYIDNAILNMANDINNFVKKEKIEKEDILILPILKGAVCFASDLLRRLTFELEIDFLKASSYHDNEQTSQVLVDIQGVSVKDKIVILLDDVCDSGKTLKKLEQIILENGAKKVYTAVLIKRDVESVYTPTWIGIHDSSADWFVGFGMDDCQKWRQLPEIYIIEH